MDEEKKPLQKEEGYTRVTQRLGEEGLDGALKAAEEILAEEETKPSKPPSPEEPEKS